MLSTARQFDPATALKLAHVSAGAYTLTPPKGDYWSFVAKSFGCRMMLLRREGQYVLAFKGTDDARDWMTDLEVRLSPAGTLPGLAHAGFLKEADFVLQALALDWIATWVTGPLFITGHSKGASIAALVAARLAAIGVEVAPVYAFGCPRFGNAEFAANYQPTLFRVVDDVDLIPHTPPCLRWSKGLPSSWYRHAGVQITLADGAFTEGTTLLQSLVNFVNGCRSKGVLHEIGETFSDHGIENYVASLEAMQPPEALGMAA